jgi:hypothetical protein
LQLAVSTASRRSAFVLFGRVRHHLVLLCVIGPTPRLTGPRPTNVDLRNRAARGSG